MKNSVFIHINLLLILGIFTISACGPKESNKSDVVIADPDLNKLESYLAKAGVYQTWRSLDYIQFNLHSIQYASDRTILSDNQTEYKFGYNYGMHGHMKWSKNGEEHEFIKKNDSIQFFKQKETVENDSIIFRYEKIFLENHFSFGLPFKFMDPKLRRRWVEQSPFDIQGAFDILHVIHEKTDLHYLPSDEQWWAYFDQKTGLIKAYLVFHEAQYYLTIIEDFIDVGEFSFPSSFSTYKLDDSLENRFLLKYNQYSNFHLKYLDGRTL